MWTWLLILSIPLNFLFLAFNCQIIPEESEYQNFPLPFRLPQNVLTARPKQTTFMFGGCKIIFNGVCPDPNINFFLFTISEPDHPQPVMINGNCTNLQDTQFNPLKPTKIIVHGYNSDMNLSALLEIRKEYLRTTDYNIFTVDWSPLNQAPCYLAALINIRLVGACTSHLIERIRELGASDIHIIGFSLGAHITNYVALNLRPYILPRITGLDPALPGFITPNIDEKLDKTDATFVDVYHTSAFLQGKVEESGHVDFYLNGGIIQPGCWAENRFFACNHHRAPIYFAESINTEINFYGWPCPSYFKYLQGSCPIIEPQVIMGERVNEHVKGVYLVITESVSPYAVGKYEGPNIEIYLKYDEKHRKESMERYKDRIMEYVGEDDEELIMGMFGERKRTTLISSLVKKIRGLVENTNCTTTNVVDE